MRLFVGLELPETHREALAALRRPMGGARWVATENFHLTLRFVGEIDEDGAQDLDACLAAIAAPGFVVRLQGAGTFGNGRRTRAVWAGVAPAPGLAALQSKVERAAQRAGCAPEGRKFAPHVTLARAGRGNGPVPAAQLSAFLDAHAGLDLPAFEVTSFALFSSVLTRDGPHYAVEARYDLAPAEPDG